MSANKTRGPIIDPGLCRCCGTMKKCRLLNVEYDHLGHKEVYSDMIMDCFGLLLSNMDGEECDRLVCATCVVRLREALTFRRQVLNCEEAFLLKIQRDGDNQFKVEVKLEEDAESVRDYDDAGDDHVETDNPISDNDSAIEKPATKKQTLRKRIKREKNTTTEPKKRRSVNKKGAVNGSEHLRMKRDLLNRMQKLKAMLNQKLKPAPPSPAPAAVTPRPTRRSEDNSEPPIRRTSPDRMLHYNRVAIVENSYVFPFKNRISNYYCYYCKEIFTDCNELRTHTLTHDPKTFENSMESKRVPKIDITQIDCRLCPEKIDDLESFKQHVSSVHKKIIYPAITNEFLKFRLTMDNLNCLECGTSFPFIDKLIEHMTDHFGKFVCDICGACFIEEATLCQHMRGHKKIDENFPCDVCGKNLKSNYSRQLHIATVHEKRPVVACYKCDASFLSYAQRNRHLINVHGDKRKFTCKACDKVFDVRKTMVEHTRKYHLQVCRHQCDICEQRFHAPSQLKEHKASHTGERNFRCEYCDKSYPRRQSLQDHIRSHTNDRRYKCDICNSTFTQNGSLKNHMKTHHQGFDLAAAFTT